MKKNEGEGIFLRGRPCRGRKLSMHLVNVWCEATSRMLEDMGRDEESAQNANDKISPTMSNPDFVQQLLPFAGVFIGVPASTLGGWLNRGSEKRRPHLGRGSLLLQTHPRRCRAQAQHRLQGAHEDRAAKILPDDSEGTGHAAAPGGRALPASQ